MFIFIIVYNVTVKYDNGQLHFMRKRRGGGGCCTSADDTGKRSQFTVKLSPFDGWELGNFVGRKFHIELH